MEKHRNVQQERDEDISVLKMHKCFLQENAGLLVFPSLFFFCFWSFFVAVGDVNKVNTHPDPSCTVLRFGRQTKLSFPLHTAFIWNMTWHHFHMNRSPHISRGASGVLKVEAYSRSIIAGKCSEGSEKSNALQITSDNTHSSFQLNLSPFIFQFLPLELPVTSAQGARCYESWGGEGKWQQRKIRNRHSRRLILWCRRRPTTVKNLNLTPFTLWSKWWGNRDAQYRSRYLCPVLAFPHGPLCLLGRWLEVQLDWPGPFWGNNAMRRQPCAMQAIRSGAFYSGTLTYSFHVHALELHCALSGRRRCLPPGLQPGQWVNTYSPIVHDFQAFQQNLQRCISTGRPSSLFINLKAGCLAPFNHI